MTHCNTQQHTTTRCNTLPLLHSLLRDIPSLAWRTATHCNTLQHAAIHSSTCSPVRHAQLRMAHCNTLQCTVTRCNKLQQAVTSCKTLLCILLSEIGLASRDAQPTAIHCYSPQHSLSFCKELYYCRVLLQKRPENLGSVYNKATATHSLFWKGAQILVGSFAKKTWEFGGHKQRGRPRDRVISVHTCDMAHSYMDMAHSYIGHASCILEMVHSYEI